MTTTKYFTFFDGAESPTTSKQMSNASAESIVFVFSGSGSASVEGQQGSVWCKLALVKLADITIVTEMDSEGSYVLPCPEGYIALRVVLDSVNSPVTVTARCATSV